MSGRGTPVGVDVVEWHWPYDGPHGPERVVEAASALSGLVRYVANATGPGRAPETLPYAVSVHRVLSGLSGAVGSVEQLVRQLIAVVRDQSGDPSLYDDRGDRPAVVTAGQLRERLGVVRLKARMTKRAFEDDLANWAGSPPVSHAQRLASMRASGVHDHFDLCRHCGIELSYMGRYMPEWWLDAWGEATCEVKGRHQPCPGYFRSGPVARVTDWTARAWDRLRDPEWYRR